MAGGVRYGDTTLADDTVLSEQLDYYRARAGEYDKWWLRQGRFDRGAEANARWFAETAQLERALERFAPTGAVLELAGGTGLWTRRLAPYATSLTVVDAAPEVLAINRERVGDPAVRYLEADLFDFAPDPGAYDACVFSFWLSHVPADHFAAFWQMVGSALRPGGRVLFIDSARTERSTAADHQLPGQDEQTMTRRLDDGREFQIVKRFYDPPQLSAELAELGWECRMHTTGEFFIYGTATPADGHS
jgi:demethylmenaquinone methyltransferase/2-methoxy-6-polyprenyl-1,4-benzoquinol methylase